MMNWVRWLVLLTQYLPPVSAASSLLLIFGLLSDHSPLTFRLSSKTCDFNTYRILVLS